MKGKSIRILCAIFILLMGLSAIGCSGVPMPKEGKDYTTWVESVRLPDVEALDIVHVSFSILFKKEDADGNVGQRNEIRDLFYQCNGSGTCGTTARVYVDGNDVDKIVSCTCRLTDLETIGSNYKSRVTCAVPIPGGMNKNKEYKLLLSSIAPAVTDESPSADISDPSKQNLVFSSSPAFVVNDMLSNMSQFVVLSQ